MQLSNSAQHRHFLYSSSKIQGNSCKNNASRDCLYILGSISSNGFSKKKGEKKKESTFEMLSLRLFSIFLVFYDGHHKLTVEFW